MVDYDHISYMEDIATRLKEIQHKDSDKRFHRVSSLFDLEEFIATGTGKKAGFHLLVKDIFSLRRNYSGSPISERQFFTYYLLKYSTKNFDNKETIKRELRTLERKIFSKYKKDHYNDIHEDIAYGLEELDLGSFVVEDIKLVSTGFVGIQVTFTNEPIVNINYSANDWLNE